MKGPSATSDCWQCHNTIKSVNIVGPCQLFFDKERQQKWKWQQAMDCHGTTDMEMLLKDWIEDECLCLGFDLLGQRQWRVVQLLSVLRTTKVSLNTHKGMMHQHLKCTALINSCERKHLIAHFPACELKHTARNPQNKTCRSRQMPFCKDLSTSKWRALNKACLTMNSNTASKRSSLNLSLCLWGHWEGSGQTLRCMHLQTPSCFPTCLLEIWDPFSWDWQLNHLASCTQKVTCILKRPSSPADPFMLPIFVGNLRRMRHLQLKSTIVSPIQSVSYTHLTLPTNREV